MSPTAMRLVVMGVSGCGKSTVALELARVLNLEMTDGDDLHHPASVAKMRAGVALQDSDRWPWLDAIGQLLAQPQQSREHGREHGHEHGCVIACSALKRAYRDRIRTLAPGVCFVFLQGSPALIAARLSRRQDHFMAPELLESQFRTLEVPGADEPDVVTVSIDQALPDLIAQAVARVHAQQTGSKSV